ncbi:MAG: serine/threonine protein kinase [Polyangiaceae bacterium]|nr:serine/threonine protein kinase [Polyangiaceae bacterium]
MKACDACHRLFEDTSGFCPIDGTKLEPVATAKLPSDPEDNRIGKRLCGRYVIYRVVADGGMGRVYQALDEVAQRNVALKILHPDVATDTVAVERFKREFEVSTSLRHTNIVEVLGFERTDDASYALVMEYLEGEELRMLLKREKLMKPERVIRMASQVALGLEAAHARKQVHRDLKPDNLFLGHTPDGDVTKILDFGSVRDNNENAKKLTVMGTTIGSPFYMAPEQAQGLATLDHRADIWSLAAIVYESLTGKVPFMGNTGPSILLAILTQEPDPISQVGAAQNVPATMDEVIEIALAKNPEIRYASIGAFVDAFGRAYGLEGDHRAWATTSEATVCQQIAERLPSKLVEHQQKGAQAASFRDMDAAFRSSPTTTTSAGRAGSEASLPADYVIMGLPPARPAWFWPAIGGGAIVVVAIVAFLVTR